MELSNGLHFPNDFEPIWNPSGKRYKIRIVNYTKYHKATKITDSITGAEIYVLQPDHKMDHLVREILLQYDLRNAGERAEWTALLISLILLENDGLEIILVSDRIAKLLKELNSSTDMERLMNRVEALHDIKEDILKRMGIEVRRRSKILDKKDKLAINVVEKP